MNNKMMNSATNCAKKGWKVFPLHSAKNGSCSCGNIECVSVAKHPRIRDWQKECSTQIDKIRYWWGKWPEANIGLATGSASGFFVLDIDPRHGGKESFQEMMRKYGSFPNTIASNTGGGGFHLLFNYPEVKITNKTNLMPGIDIRGEGGYIVAPPSSHKSGMNYAWTRSLDQGLLKDAPTWLIDKIINPIKPYSHSAVKREGRVTEGGRNNFLAIEAGKLWRLGLQQRQLMFELQKINNSFCRPPLDDGELSKICASISKYANGRVTEFVQQSSWPDQPQPFSSAISAPSMSPDLLPECFKAWVMDISDRMQVTPEFVAAPALVGFSSIVGRKLIFYPKQHDKWKVVPNLWGLLVARPGYFKSPTIAEAMKPIEKLGEVARKQFEEEKSYASAQHMLSSMKLEAMKDVVKRAFKNGQKDELAGLKEEIRQIEEEAEKSKLVERRYKTNDATIEKIARLLNENPNGLLLLRDEINGWLQTMTKAGREGDREFYLESWNGYNSHSSDRVGSGTLHVPALCLSVFGGIQPGKLQSYVEKTICGDAGDDGLLQRFQVLIYPELSKTWSNVDRAPNAIAEKKAMDIFQSVSEINIDPSKEIPRVNFCLSAQDLFNSWREDLEPRVRSSEISPAFESHLAKYRSLMPSLALLFWLLENPNNIHAKGAVSLTATKKAIDWCAFLKKHAIKAYAIGQNAQNFAAMRLGQFIERGVVKNGMTVRSIYRKQWAQLESTHLVDAALESLEELGWLRVIHTTVQGGRTKKIELHPKFCSNNNGENHGYQIKNGNNGVTKNYSNTNRGSFLGADND